MTVAYNHRFFALLNEGRIAEGKKKSTAYSLAERAMRIKAFELLVFLFEISFGFLLALKIPVYSTLVYVWVTHLPGLPSFFGMYIRSLYYRRKLKVMESNVLIDQNVIIAHPDKMILREFVYLDKYVTIMSNNTTIGRRVHIAPRVIVTGGGDLLMGDYTGIATGSNIVTATEVLKGGARCCGPLVDPKQRNVFRSKVSIEKDAFIGASATILPGVVIAQGSVVGANVVISKSTEPWGIYVGAKANRIAQREKVIWEDN